MNGKTSKPDTLVFLGCIICGSLIGYYWQIMADSGEIHIQKIATTCTLAIGSYLAAFLMAVRLKKNRESQIWLFVAITGSVLCAFTTRVIKWLVENWRYRESSSIRDYVISQLPQVGLSFILNIPVYAVIALAVIGTTHLVGRQLRHESKNTRRDI
jgi:ABC-type amino acid transport system permease subunit